MFGGLQQGMGAIGNFFGQKSTDGQSSSSSKRPLTAAEKAQLGAFVSDLANDLNNGFGQITPTGKMVSDVNSSFGYTTAQASSSANTNSTATASNSTSNNLFVSTQTTTTSSNGSSLNNFFKKLS